MPRERTKLLSQGAQGCVFAPALPCAGPVTRLRAARAGPIGLSITKVFGRTDAYRHEWGVAAAIAAIDPGQQRFLYPTETCQVARATVERATQECKLLATTRRRRLPSMRLRNGGRSFSRWLGARERPPTDVELVALLLPCFEALQLLARARIVHQDIKANNLVIDDLGAVRLIDFGLHTRFDELYQPELNARALSKSWVLPPEYRLRRRMAAAESGAATGPALLATGPALLATERAALRRSFSPRDVTQLERLHELFWPDGEAAAALRGAYLALRRHGTTALDAAKVDVYGLGMVLMWAAQHLAAPPQARFVALVRGMTHPAVAARWSVDRALRMARRLVA